MHHSLQALIAVAYKADLKTVTRWLWRQGRRKEAIEVLRWMARINGRSLDGKMLDSLEHHEEEKCMMEEKLVDAGSNEALHDVLKYPRVVFRFCVMLIMQ